VEDSVISWIVNIILAFLIVKFLIYPGLGLALGTGYPVVAVVSSSMHHNGNFDEWFTEKGEWYNLDKEEIRKWIFSDGFNSGDIIFLKGANDIEVGDVIVFVGNSKNPIIHRIVEVHDDYYVTKGDNNDDSYIALGESHIEKNQIIGEAFGRVPILGYVKIIFSEVLGG
jgi:signal peptidase I